MAPSAMAASKSLLMPMLRWRNPAPPILCQRISSNVPYLSQSEVDGSAPEIREHEPNAAVSAGNDGLAAMRGLAPVLARQLRKNGLAFVEIGAGQAVAVTRILGYFGLDVGHIASDLSGVPRCLVVGRAGDVAHRPQRNQLEKGH